MLALLLPFLAAPADSRAIARDDFAHHKWADCWSFNANVTASSVNLDVASVISTPRDQYDWIESNVEYYARNSTIQEQVFAAAQHPVSGTYSLYFEYCQPKNGTPKGVFEAVHGIVGNAAYWDPKVEDDEHVYSFPDAAAEFGWATLSYDRLGVGRSDHPDGLNVVQQAYETAQAVEISDLLRSGGLGNGLPSFQLVIGVGHSYGSLILTSTAAISPDAFDALILTGAAGDLAVQSPDSLLAAGGVEQVLANTAMDRWKGLDNNYISSPSQAIDQKFFFHYPNFTSQALDAFTATKGEFSIGQQRTSGAFALLDRSNYHKPTFALTGQFDAPACLAQCDVTQLPGFKDQVDATRQFFPGVANDDFEYYIVPDTGHGINFHTTAYDAYQKAFDFVSRRF